MRLKTTFLKPAGRPWPATLGALLGAAVLIGSFGAAEGGILEVGNILTFSTGSTAGNPTGTWTLDDKSFTYLEQSGFVMTGTGGSEEIKIVSNGGNLHSFTLGSLENLTTSGTYTLGYRVDVVPPSPYWLSSVELDSTHIGSGLQVYKDVFSSFSLFQSGTVGSGNLAALSSFNGQPDGPDPLSTLPTQIWVRDTIVLSGSNVGISSVSNTYTQQMVPEIDPGSAAPVMALVLGGLAFAERRRRGAIA